MKKTAEELAGIMETWLGAVAFLSMFFAIVLQVLFRYVFGNPLVWPFEFSVYCYIYVIYIGAVMAARRQTHVSFGLIYERLPERMRLALSVITNSFIVVIFMATIPSGIEYIKMVGGVPSTSLAIPWGVVLAVFPLGMGLIALTLGLRAYRDAMFFLGRRG